MHEKYIILLQHNFFITNPIQKIYTHFIHTYRVLSHRLCFEDNLCLCLFIYMYNIINMRLPFLTYFNYYEKQAHIRLFRVSVQKYGVLKSPPSMITVINCSFFSSFSSCIRNPI